jgi:threonyl-tRNA synthetase
MERFIAIITEHFAGKWCEMVKIQVLSRLTNIHPRPFWLSPRQVLVIPVALPYVGICGICPEWD